MLSLLFWVNVFLHLGRGGAGHRLRVKQGTVMRISYLSVYTWTPIKGNWESLNIIFCWLSFSLDRFCDEITRKRRFVFVMIVVFFVVVIVRKRTRRYKKDVEIISGCYALLVYGRRAYARKGFGMPLLEWSLWQICMI